MLRAVQVLNSFRNSQWPDSLVSGINREKELCSTGPHVTLEMAVSTSQVLCSMWYASKIQTTRNAGRVQDVVLCVPRRTLLWWSGSLLQGKTSGQKSAVIYTGISLSLLLAWSRGRIRKDHHQFSVLLLLAVYSLTTEIQEQTGVQTSVRSVLSFGTEIPLNIRYWEGVFACH